MSFELASPLKTQASSLLLAPDISGIYKPPFPSHFWIGIALSLSLSLSLTCQILEDGYHIHRAEVTRPIGKVWQNRALRYSG